MDKEVEIMNRLDRHEFTPSEQKRWDKLGENCTSGCGKDFDCPHEEELYTELLEEALLTLSGADKLTIIKKQHG